MVDRYAEVLLDWHEAVGHLYDEVEEEPEPAKPIDEKADDTPSTLEDVLKKTQDTPEDPPAPGSRASTPERPTPPKRAVEP